MKRGGAMEIPQADLCSSLVILFISCINLVKLLNFMEPLEIKMNDLQGCCEECVLSSKQLNGRELFSCPKVSSVCLASMIAHGNPDSLDNSTIVYFLLASQT